MRLEAREVAAAIGGRLTQGDGKQVLTGVGIDSRTIGSGYLFFALPGKTPTDTGLSAPLWNGEPPARWSRRRWNCPPS